MASISTTLPKVFSLESPNGSLYEASGLVFGTITQHFGLPRWLSGKEFACQCRRHWFNPGLGRSPGEGNGNSLQYSYLQNSMDRGAWWTTIHGVTKGSDMTYWLNNHGVLYCRTLPLCLAHVTAYSFVSAQISVSHILLALWTPLKCCFFFFFFSGFHLRCSSLQFHYAFSG